MTNNEINIAIAEACGWTIYGKPHQLIGRPQGYGFNDGPCMDIPDYCNDLNAMAAVEKSLKEPERFAYEIILHKLNMKYGLGISVWETVHATAKQRAEAFLRLRELWVDD